MEGNKKYTSLFHVWGKINQRAARLVFKFFNLMPLRRNQILKEKNNNRNFQMKNNSIR